MTLQERIRNNTRLVGINISNGVTLVEMQFGKNWTATGSGEVKCAKGEEIADRWFFYSPLDGASLDEILDVAEENVATNMTIEMKRNLYKAKVVELEAFFNNHEYEDLLSLSFEITPSKKSRKKNTKEKETVNTETNTQEIEDAEPAVENPIKEEVVCIS